MAKHEHKPIGLRRNIYTNKVYEICSCGLGRVPYSDNWDTYIDFTMTENYPPKVIVFQEDVKVENKPIQKWYLSAWNANLDGSWLQTPVLVINEFAYWPLDLEDLTTNLKEYCNEVYWSEGEATPEFKYQYELAKAAYKKVESAKQS